MISPNREQTNQEFLNPDITIEQTLSFVQQAQEIMQNKKSAYDFVIIPDGPLLFTGILQACGHLLVKDQKHFLFILQQDTQPNNILVGEDTIGTFMGTHWKAKSISKTLIQKSYIKKITLQEKEEEKLSIHLPFLRIINQPETVTTLFVGNNVTQQQLQETITTIKAKETTIFFVTNLHEKKDYETTKAYDYKLLKKIVENKEKNTTESNLLSIFQDFCVQEKKQPELIAYINSGELSSNAEYTTGYACIVG